MLPLSKAQARLAHSILLPREAYEKVETLVRMTILTLLDSPPKCFLEVLEYWSIGVLGPHYSITPALRELVSP